MKSVNSRAGAKNFEKIKNKVLGSNYELSLVFASDILTRRLNRTYLGIDKPTNILAFSLSKTSGEIFINRSRAKPFSVKYLFIHGLLHLKGYRHGSRMEREEIKFRKKFGI